MSMWKNLDINVIMVHYIHMKLVLLIAICLIMFLFVASRITIKTPIIFDIIQNVTPSQNFTISAQTHGGFNRWLHYSGETDIQTGDFEYVTGFIQVGSQQTIFNTARAVIRESNNGRNILRINAFIDENNVRKIIDEIRNGRDDVKILFEYKINDKKHYTIIEDGITAVIISQSETLLNRIGNFILAPFFRNMRMF